MHQIITKLTSLYAQTYLAIKLFLFLITKYLSNRLTSQVFEVVSFIVMNEREGGVVMPTGTHTEGEYRGRKMLIHYCTLNINTQ